MVVRELPLDLAAALPLALGAGEEVELRGARRRAQRTARAHRGRRQPRGVDRRRRLGRCGARRSGVVRRQGRASHPGALDQRHGRCSLRSAWWRGAARDDAAAGAPGRDARRPAGVPAPRGDLVAGARSRGRRSAHLPRRGRRVRRSTASSRPACWRPAAPCARGRAPTCCRRRRTASGGTSRSPPTCAKGTTSSPCGRAARAPAISARAGARADRGGGSPGGGHPGAGDDRSADALSPIAGRSPRRGATTSPPGACAATSPCGSRMPTAGRSQRRSPSGELAVDLAPGDYRLIVLPQAVPARAVVVASRGRCCRASSPATARTRSLSTREAANLWLEPAGGGAARSGPLALHSAGADRRDDHPFRRDDG